MFALIPITHAPPMGEPEPASVTVPAIAPRVEAMAGSAWAIVSAGTTTVVGGPKNPATCVPAGSITYR